MNGCLAALKRAWRVFATGLSFAVFGVGTVLITVTVFPILCLLMSSVDRRRRRLQRIFSGGCRFFIWLMRSLGLLTWEVHGREHLTGRSGLVLANHPTLIDAVFLLAWMPEVVCIVKQSLRQNPFLGWAVEAAGYIGNAAPAKLIDECIASLEAGHSLIIFPEGTRSVPGRCPVFRRGAARVVLGVSAPVIPVRIGCQPITLTKSDKWYRVPERPAHYVFEVGAPLAAADFGLRPGESSSQAARRVTGQLQDLLRPVDATRTDIGQPGGGYA